MTNNRLMSVVVLTVVLTAPAALAQVRVYDPKETAERNVEGRVNGRIDQGINRGLDKVEEGIGTIFKKKEKKPRSQKPADDTYDQSTPEAETNETVNAPEKASGRQRAGREPVASRADEPRSLRAYSKFDFVPGEKVVAVEDFAQDAVGDFPAKWNTNASGEVVTLDGQSGKWLAVTQNGYLYPEFLKVLPENFTLEMNMVITPGLDNNMLGTALWFLDSKAYPNLLQSGTVNAVQVQLHPGGGDKGYSYVKAWDAADAERLTNELYTDQWVSGKKPTVKLSVWRQKTRLRVYLDETKIWDIPRAFDPATPYRLLLERGFFTTENQAWYLSNLRVAVGTPDTRSKLITEGKFSTTGILFDVNSATIKPESYGVLKEIGTVLKENASVQVKIIGHTDADGDDASNLALSKRRADSVRAALSKEFGIDASRMDTDGKGESQPVGSNTTAEGKANNRRVEFIKL
ncbi:OmpA family protein [Spirosoma montaniterrae]|uniref:OmpA-like domain-containing protein n=1 Tax=Spirosoma montaniterrae TaxID=1178516 RepID=A0A1P9WVM2_9BACT|nr:OmpA family protein [Spirosoma montaniterrae]AQG79436.1 hypothetical protein AWR27_08960 [Spirosoma montaniterrae]